MRNKMGTRKRIAWAFLPAAFAPVFIGGCASMSALQTARTLPQGQVVVVGAAGVTGVHVESSDPGAGDEDFVLPVVESMARLGVWPGLDVGLKYFVGGILADAKYQFHGREPASDTGLAAGFGVDYSGRDVNWWDLYFPIYASYDPSEWFSVYGSPRYVLRLADTLGNHHLLGAVGGIAMGKEKRVFIEAGYMLDTGLGLVKGPSFQGTVGLTLDSKRLFSRRESPPDSPSSADGPAVPAPN
ncbi:MAG: hypothetical protein HYT87_17340 [Nitrospirae bacterium]|nr:hypothetical protein [Nitrospirota bacterium]